MCLFSVNVSHLSEKLISEQMWVWGFSGATENTKNIPLFPQPCPNTQSHKSNLNWVDLSEIVGFMLLKRQEVPAQANFTPEERQYLRSKTIAITSPQFCAVLKEDNDINR